MLQEAFLPHEHRRTLGVALAAVGGAAAGLVVGVILGELWGEAGTDRVKTVVRRLRRTDAPRGNAPDEIKVAILNALQETPATERLDLHVDVFEDGLVELAGRAPDERTREVARRLASEVQGVDVVVNRILVDGVDQPPAASVDSP